jgi:tetratricopeptide (TPR) repeat protein
MFGTMANVQLTPELQRAAQAMQAGQLDDAERRCRAALRRNKRNAAAHHLLGMIATRRDLLTQAQTHFEQTLKLNPKDIATLNMLAHVLIRLGAYDDAQLRFDQALAVDPTDIDAMLGKADALEHLGRFDAARNVLEAVLSSGVQHEKALLLYATIQQRMGQHREAVDTARRAIADASPSRESRAKMLFLQGRSLDSLGEYDDAFAAFQEANAIIRVSYDPSVDRQKVSEIMRIFSPENLARFPRASNRSALPVFIVSMPRSGSTLTEQILAAHPKVFGAGESLEMPRRVRELAQESQSKLPFPSVMLEFDERTANRLANRHLGLLRQLDAKASRITDKHLRLHLILGLASILFPSSRAIDCRRHPMDVCLSCFIMELAPNVLPYTTNLRDIGLYYRQFDRLVRHWHEVLDIPMLTLHYEQLVSDPPGKTRELLEFCELKWDEACLRFHAQDRKVATASYDQVRRPIYTSARHRFRHYQSYLEPLRDALGDLAAD